ncbi:MAG: hypothetical protein M3O90_07700 [Actinomycetota bacterium]|jgi:GGDEF domain-containing protein|nr:hypothetical protein [Actinomycetota bacterium]
MSNESNPIPPFSTVKAAIADTRCNATLSVGVAPFEGSARCSHDDVVRAADAAMYSAKAQGGDSAVLAATQPLARPAKRRADPRTARSD